MRFKPFSKNNNNSRVKAERKIDRIPKQIDFPVNTEGLGTYIAQHKVGEGKTFKYAVLHKTNPLTEDEMANMMSSAGSNIIEKEAKEYTHEIILNKSVVDINFEELIKEKHKKCPYIAIPYMIMLFEPMTSWKAKYYKVDFEIIDNRFEEEEQIRYFDIDGNAPYRIMMGIDFSFHRRMLSKLTFRITSGYKEGVEWGVFTMTPSTRFLSSPRSQMLVKTFGVPLITDDSIKKMDFDPTKASGIMVQQDREALQEIYEADELRDESKPDKKGASRECYEGTQFAKERPSTGPNKPSLRIDNWRKEYDEASTTSSKLREQVINETGSIRSVSTSSKIPVRIQPKENITKKDKGKKKGNTIEEISESESILNPNIETDEESSKSSVKEKKKKFNIKIEDVEDEDSHQGPSGFRIRSPPPSYVPSKKAVGFNSSKKKVNFSK